MSQDLAAVAAPIQAAAKPSPRLPEPEQKLRCPRCDSIDTKFCYYNNYNLSQPRHFCKDCRRYWTKGGALRNVPVGGGTRKSSKRASSSSSAAPASKRSNPVKPATCPTEIPASDPISVLYPPLDADHQFLDVAGSFSSLLACTGHFNGLLNSFVSHGGAAFVVPNYMSNVSSSTVGVHGMELQSSTGSSGVENMAPPLSNDNLLGLHAEYEYWSGVWPDLSIYNADSDLQ